MRIGIIGTGNMASGLGGRFATVGHDVVVGSRDPDRAAALAAAIGAKAGSYRDAAEHGEAILFAVPWWGVDETLAELGDLDGTILIDTTNPYKDATYAEQHRWVDDSGAEQIQRKAPGARVVKAWNHVYAQVVHSEPVFGGTRAAVFVAGDDGGARAAVMELARSIGYDAEDAGPLSSARYLEPLAGLMVTIAYGLGKGTDQVLAVARR